MTGHIFFAQTIKMLIRLHGCTDRSAVLLFIYIQLADFLMKSLTYDKSIVQVLRKRMHPIRVRASNKCKISDPNQKNRKHASLMIVER